MPNDLLIYPAVQKAEELVEIGKVPESRVIRAIRFGKDGFVYVVSGVLAGGSSTTKIYRFTQSEFGIRVPETVYVEPPHIEDDKSWAVLFWKEGKLYKRWQYEDGSEEVLTFDLLADM